MIFELHPDDPNLRRLGTTEPLNRVVSEVMPPRGTAIVFRNRKLYVGDIEAHIAPIGEYSLPSLEWRIYVREQPPTNVAKNEVTIQIDGIDGDAVAQAMSKALGD